jgi:hypothetical protein
VDTLGRHAVTAPHNDVRARFGHHRPPRRKPSRAAPQAPTGTWADGEIPLITVAAIEQNEPTDGGHDGNTPIDGVIEGATALRARGPFRQPSVACVPNQLHGGGRIGCVVLRHGHVVVPHDPARTGVPAVTTWFFSTGSN